MIQYMWFWYLLCTTFIFIIVALWYKIRYYRMVVRAMEIRNETEMRDLRAQLMEETALIMKRKEKALRQDAITRSQNVTKGKVAEQIAPYLPDFPYDPRDLRFLGSPVDYVVFDGMTEGSIHKIVFLEIKTGKYARLTTRERDVEEVLNLRRATYELIKTQD